MDGRGLPPDGSGLKVATQARKEENCQLIGAACRMSIFVGYLVLIS